MNFAVHAAPLIQAWLEKETGFTYKQAKSGWSDTCDCNLTLFNGRKLESG